MTALQLRGEGRARAAGARADAQLPDARRCEQAAGGRGSAGEGVQGQHPPVHADHQHAGQGQGDLRPLARLQGRGRQPPPRQPRRARGGGGAGGRRARGLSRHLAPLLRHEGQVARARTSSPTGTATRRCPTAPSASCRGRRRRRMVLDAYGAFAPDMAKIAKRFFDGAWIDAPVREGKSPGAFSHPTVPSVHPYILMNYQGKPRDVMTLAHELGHGVHQVLAAPLGPLLAPTPLTLAETASVFGEMLDLQGAARVGPGPQGAQGAAGAEGGGHDQHGRAPDRLLCLRAARARGAQGGRAHLRAARADLARRAGREPGAGHRAEGGLRDLLVLRAPLHPLAVLRLRLCLRRLPGELALRPLPGRAPRLRRQVLRHAEGRRLQAPLRAAEALRTRCLASAPSGRRASR